MRKTTPQFAAAAITLFLALGASAFAQNSLATATNGQAIVSSLSNLPEADTMIYISPHRILADAAPHLLPEKELSEMREGFGEVKKQTGIDPLNIDYLVGLVRFKKPTADLNFSLPEFLVVVSGDFSADALLLLARQATGAKLRDEKYGSRSISLLALDGVAKAAEKNSFLKSLSELAIAALNGNTIVVGTPSYVKAAMDAADGKGRVNTDLLNSLMRDPTVLMSSAGSPIMAFAKTFALLGTESNPRPSRFDTKLGDYYSSITMDAQSFKLRGAMNADNPDTAKIIKSLLSSLLQQASSSIKDKDAQTVLSSVMITPTETEVLVQAEISQQWVADLIREQMKPKQPAATSPAPVKHRVRRRRPVTHAVAPPPPKM